VRRFITICLLLALVVAAWLWWRSPESHHPSGVAAVPTITKQQANIVTRTFDPQNPPADMPPLSPGEIAVCDSNFMAKANVGGDARETDSTHGIVTITKVDVTLQLNITIWIPPDASQHVIEHEEGHRQISEFFYQSADALAAQIAAQYLGKKDSINGTDLHAELGKQLQQIGAEITEQYAKQLNPDPTQLRYDAITDHSRNDVAASDAVAQVLKDVSLPSPRR
jgi:hypothetical protein